MPTNVRRLASEFSGPTPRDTFIPDLLRATLDSLPTAVVVWIGPDHRLAFANRSFAELFGLEENVLDRSARELWPDAQPLHNLLDRVLTIGESISDTAASLPVREEGRARDAIVAFDLVPLEGNDAPLGVIASVRAVSFPDKRLEPSRLAEALERLQPVLVEMGVEAALFDREGRPLMPGGGNPNTLQRRTDSDGASSARDSAWLTAALGGEPVRGLEVRVARSGREAPYLRIHAAPVRTDLGEVAGAIALFHDQTPAHRRFPELDERTHELTGMLESIDQGLLFVDPQGRVRFTNRRLRAMFEAPAILLTPGAPSEYFHRHLRGLMPAGLSETGVNAGELDEVVVPGPTPRYFAIDRREVRSPDGELLGMLEAYREVTRLKHDERRQDELLTRLEQDRRRLQTLELITRIGLSTFNVREMSDVLLQRVLRASNAQAGELLLFDPDADRLSPAASHGFTLPTDGALPLDSGLVVEVARADSPITLSGENLSSRAPHYRLAGFEGGTLVGLPLIANGRRVGAMLLGYLRETPFGPSDLSVLQILGDRVALVVENARLMEHTARQARELNALLDNLTEGIVVAEPTGRVVRLNRTALSLLGLPDARDAGADQSYKLIINDTQGRPIPPDETPLARAARGESFSEEDLWITGLDNVRRRVAVSGGPVRDEKGRVTFGFCVFRDITDLRELELIERALAEETRAQREFLEGIFQAAPIGLIVVSEPDHVIEMANPIARRWTGLDDPVGLRYTRVVHDPAVLESLERAVATRETQNLVDRELNVRGQESRYFSTTFLPLLEDDQTVHRVLVVSWETTDTIRSRQRAEELAMLAQQHSEELEAVIAQLPEGVVIADAPHGRIRLLNPAALSMAAWLRSGPLGQTTHRPVFETVRPNGEPFGNDDPLAVALTQGKTVAGVEALLRQPEDRTLPVLVSAAPLRGPTREISGAVLTFRDITTLKEIDRLKDEFLSMASHELKTPLTAVKGFSQLLLRRARKSASTDERTMRALETIDEKVNYMSRLIEDLLDLSRVETDRLELRPTRCDLVALARTKVAELQMVTDAHTLSLEAELDTLVGYWDEGRLEQVLINLTDNAIKYSPDGGPVMVRVAERDGHAFVSVTDRGLGIPPENQRRLFERFYRAHEDRFAIGGLGLGLYLSSEIIRRHNGQIGVESDVGKGSTFWFSLPVKEMPNLK